jgi:uncharacterized protein YpmS
MDDNKTRSYSRKNNRSPINGWKWAFIFLVALLLGFFIYLGINTRPAMVNEPNTMAFTTSEEEEIELLTRLDKKEMEQIINTYLEAEMGADFENYTITLTEQLEVHGQIEILTFDVPFSLYLEPYVTENGNIQLRGEEVEVGNFSLPVSSVMSLMARQMSVPDFIAVDSEQQRITINLNELSAANEFGVEMTKIDLEADEIELKLHVNKRIITDQIQKESHNE